MLLIEYILLLISLVILFHLYNKMAIYYNIVDIPNNRSSHSQITVRGGGIIFPISSILWFIFSGYQYPWFFTGLLLISTISFIDDLINISFKNRLIIHVLSLSLLGIQFNLFLFPWWIWIPVLILLTGIINAFNFMDGINGITGGYSLSVLLGIWLVNNFQIKFIENELIYYTSIAVIVFNYYNFRKRARCFAGDVGSISIAFIIVFLITKLILLTGNYLYLMFLTMYGVDTIYTIIYRIINKENIFEPHRKHLYQLLANEYKIPHTKVSFIYSFIQIIISLTIIIASFKYKNLTYSLLISLILIFTTTLIFHLIRVHIMHKKDSIVHDIRSN